MALSRKQKLAAIATTLIVLVFVLVYPIETTLVPNWRLRVIDETGKPCPNRQVNQGWKHYSIDLSAGSEGEYRFTNSEGYVEFPRRSIKATLAQRIVNPLIAYARVIAHGSVGISGYVFTSGMKNGPWLDYKPGEAMPGTILVDRCS
jgi:hypothetical protein